MMERRLDTQIDILLATYNGAAFLPEQLASLLAQTHTNWRLLLRDDGSTDGSPQIVRDWAEANGVDLLVIDEGQGNIGASASFGRLLEASTAPYFALCDQDDVWLTTKVEATLRALQDAEDDSGTPVLAYCDLVVVDRNLREIAPSFRDFCSIGSLPEKRVLRKLITQNTVTGCATMGNAALRAMALPIAPEARMHDWWLALVAGQFGRIVEMEESLILYRQHGKNSMGVNALDLFSRLRRMLRGPRQALHRYAVRRAQAQAFLDRFSDRLDHQDTAFMSDYQHGNAASIWRECVATACSRISPCRASPPGC